MEFNMTFTKDEMALLYQALAHLYDEVQEVSIKMQYKPVEDDCEIYMNNITVLKNKIRSVY